VADLPARELRNDVSRVLRRVEAGERLRVTVRGRAVAQLTPIDSRPQTIAWEAFWKALESSAADARLRRDLAEALPGDTDDVEGA
jgi:prevent-host-death family protein